MELNDIIPIVTIAGLINTILYRVFFYPSSIEILKNLNRI